MCEPTNYGHWHNHKRKKFDTLTMQSPKHSLKLFTSLVVPTSLNRRVSLPSSVCLFWSFFVCVFFSFFFLNVSFRVSHFNRLGGGNRCDRCRKFGHFFLLHFWRVGRRVFECDSMSPCSAVARFRSCYNYIGLFQSPLKWIVKLWP